MALMMLDPELRAQSLRAAFANLQAGQFRSAADELQVLAETRADDIEARLLYGLAMGALGDGRAAAPHLCAVAAMRPQNAHPLVDLFNFPIWREPGRSPEDVARAVIRLTPDDPRARHAYASWLYNAGRIEDAGDQALNGLRQGPFAPAHTLLGAVLSLRGDMEGAIYHMRQAAELEPRNAASWTNLGKILATAGQFDEALAAHERARWINPDDPRFIINQATAMLKAGRMPAGWDEFDRRAAVLPHDPLPPGRRLPKLRDAGKLTGKVILLTHVEGYGDTLQFIRYAPRLAKLGATVIVWVPPALTRIVARVEGVSKVLTGSLDLKFDFHCPMLALPSVFETTLANIPAEVPYLSADPKAAASWADRLPRDGLRVGFCWAGAARHEDAAAHAIDRQRSLPTEALAGFEGIEGISPISLQFGHAPPSWMFNPMEEGSDFADTAAIIDSLDVVVSVDTAVAHMAGGMAKTVLLLDRFDNCWRWLHGRTDNPWYPTLTIYRQTKAGEWSEPVAGAREALISRAAQSGSTPPPKRQAPSTGASRGARAARKAPAAQ